MYIEYTHNKLIYRPLNEKKAKTSVNCIKFPENWAIFMKILKLVKMRDK